MPRCPSPVVPSSARGEPWPAFVGGWPETVPKAGHLSSPREGPTPSGPGEPLGPGFGDPQPATAASIRAGPWLPVDTPAAFPADLVRLQSFNLWGHIGPSLTQADAAHNLAAHAQLCTDGAMSRGWRVRQDCANQGFNACAPPSAAHGSSRLARLISAASITTSAPTQRTASWKMGTSGACQVNQRWRQLLQWRHRHRPPSGETFRRDVTTRSESLPHFGHFMRPSDRTDSGDRSPPSTAAAAVDPAQASRWH